LLQDPRLVELAPVAKILVAGNAVFGDGNPKLNVQKLLQAVTESSLQNV